MTLYETIDLLKKIALKHPNIGSASEGNIYEYMNANPSVKYGVFFITQGTHSQDEMFNHFEFTLFYVDRLVDDMEENRLQIQSIGKEILSNILTFFCEEFDAECDNITYQPFTQKFVDMTAGIYSTITIDVPKDVICPEEYWKEDWVAPVTVIRNQDKRVVFTENGTYTIDYDPTTYTGLGNVEVNVNIDVDSYYNNGYNQGKTDGVNEQKSKLETINITENGTYSKEDGYNEIVVDVPDLNGDYNEGYEQGHTEGYNEGYTEGEGIGYGQGQADIAAKARVLEVTENGNYLSKFSDPIVPELITGVYANGTNFYSYAELNGKIFNTKIAGSINSRLEFWYKGDNTKSGDAWNVIIGSGNNDNSDCFQVRYYVYDNDTLQIEVGNSNIRVDNWDDTVWHHLIVSKAEGLWVDGEKRGDFSASNTINGEFFINGIGYDVNSDRGGSRTANGTFGMIKIDDVVFIPTADGFQNVNTGELLEVVKDGGYTFTENLPIYGEGELYKTINVNVIPKINLQKEGIKLSYGTFTEIPKWADFKGITDMSYMFSDCRNLQTIPQIDTSNVTNMGNMFYNCRNLQTVPQIDTSKVTNMGYMFSGCNNYLQTVPQIDTSNVTDMTYIFSECSSLQTIPPLNTSKVTKAPNMFDRCTSLISIPALDFRELKMNSYEGFFGWYDCPKLTDFGGFLNLKCSLTNDKNLQRLPNLTYESCINVLNGLYDFSGNGETPKSDQGQLKVAQSFIDKVGDEISIGTAKGWTITA